LVVEVPGEMRAGSGGAGDMGAGENK